MYNIHGPEMWFEWDESKARSNAKKQGVAFEEAASVFRDPLQLTSADRDHSLRERRFITVGRTTAGRLLLISYTDRHDAIRIISARKATRQERRRYEQG